ncbi:MAG: PspC domain-containing protein [Tannerella sp.]|jgi:phage shock protein PspC (stress-responsive transcriptional regulator)|nr:PspC domain-containing protein [Tannerella sp.]
MKKTLTVNLGGVVFNIDEDAYEMLDKYLTSLRLHFGKEEDADEIMNDFETRISELFNEKLQTGGNVITIAYVEEIIKRMGSPEEIFNEGEKGDGSEKQSDPTSGEEKAKKRLMRDMDDCMIGGVASGLAAYLGMDITIMRIIFIVLLVLPVPLPMVLIYIILWCVVPAAKTAADKLIMRGENVNLENIGRQVTEGFGKVNDYISSDKPRTALQKGGDLIIAIFGALMKVCAILVGIVLITVLFALVIALLVVFVGFIISIFNGAFSTPEYLHHLPVYVPALALVSGIFTVGIPLVAMIRAFLGNFMKLTPMSPVTKWVIIILWFVALFTFLPTCLALADAESIGWYFNNILNNFGILIRW